MRVLGNQGKEAWRLMGSDTYKRGRELEPALRQLWRVRLGDD